MSLIGTGAKAAWKLVGKKIGGFIIAAAPNLAKKLYDATNGKKTLAGAIITGTGIACIFVPGAQTYALDLIIAGVPVLTAGIFHKVQKAQIKKEESQDEH